LLLLHALGPASTKIDVLIPASWWAIRSCKSFVFL
jgi:hypothetical protein